MTAHQEEFFFFCPFCNEEISIIADLTHSERELIQDCEFCSRPIKIRYHSNGKEVSFFESEKDEV